MNYNEIFSRLVADGKLVELKLLYYHHWNLINIEWRNPKVCNGTQLICAARGGHDDVVIWLLENHAEIHAHDRFGKTALHLAVANGHVTTTHLLLEHGADVHHCDDVGDSPLMGAAYYGYEMVAQVLLKHGANIHQKNIFEATPIINAITNGRPRMVQFLLMAGVDANEKFWYSQTALHLVIQYKQNRTQTKVLYTFLANGANHQCRMEGGATPLLRAFQRKFRGAAKMILKCESAAPCFEVFLLS